MEISPIDRISQVIGEDFINNAVEINETSPNITLRGYAGIPTFNRGNANQLYVFVNGRIIQDKLILSTIRIAYSETIPLRRYPVIVLLLEINPTQVDVNVHPAKSDVRFRNPSMVRNFIIQSIQKSINKKRNFTSSILSNKMISSFHQENAEKFRPITYAHKAISPHSQEKLALQENNLSTKELLTTNNTYFMDDNSINDTTTSNYPLGMACAQIHQNYIISQTYDELIIVDRSTRCT